MIGVVLVRKELLVIPLTDLLVINEEVVRMLSVSDRRIVLATRHDWLRKQRMIDKSLLKRLYARIWYKQHGSPNNHVWGTSVSVPNGAITYRVYQLSIGGFDEVFSYAPKRG